MSSFLVNFGKFYEARKDREERETARAAQAQQFFSQLSQQKALAEQARAEQVRQFDLSRQDTAQSRLDAQNMAAFNAQAAGLARPAGPATDPVSGNPFLMKTVTSPEDLANPFTPQTTINEPGTMQLGSQQLVATRPEDRARALLGVKREELQIGKDLEAAERKQIQMERMTNWNAVKGSLPVPLQKLWGPKVQMGEKIGDSELSSLGGYSALMLLMGKDDEARKAMELQKLAYADRSPYNFGTPPAQAGLAKNLAMRIVGSIGRKIDMEALGKNRQAFAPVLSKALDEEMNSPEWATQPVAVRQAAEGIVRGQLMNYNPLTPGKENPWEKFLQGIQSMPEPEGLNQ